MLILSLYILIAVLTTMWFGLTLKQILGHLEVENILTSLLAGILWPYTLFLFVVLNGLDNVADWVNKL